MSFEEERSTKNNCESGNELLSLGKKMEVKVGSEFLVPVNAHQGSVLSPLLFAVVVEWM